MTTQISIIRFKGTNAPNAACVREYAPPVILNWLRFPHSSTSVRAATPVSMPALKKHFLQTAILSQRNIAILGSNCQTFCMAAQSLSDAGTGFSISKKHPQDFKSPGGVSLLLPCVPSIQKEIFLSAWAISVSAGKPGPRSLTTAAASFR